MKDGRTHRAHKAEHAVDLETGAVVAVTVAPADQGDTATLLETVPQAGEHIAEVAGATAGEGEVGVDPAGPENVVADKGYHSNDTVATLKEWEVRSYISEPQRGRRRWQDNPEAQAAVYGNRRRIGGEHGKALLRRRGEYEAVVGAIRLRSAKPAELEAVPVRVVQLSNGRAMEVRVIQNLQREDTHPLEEALALSEFNL